DGIRDGHVTGVQTCALPISKPIENGEQPLKNAGIKSRLADMSRLRRVFMIRSVRGCNADSTDLPSRWEQYRRGALANFNEKNDGTDCARRAMAVHTARNRQASFPHASLRNLAWRFRAM